MATAKYDVHPGVKMVQDWVAGLKAKTGRTLDEWLDLVRTKGPKDEAARREWLKAEHGLGTNGAWWIAERARPAAERPVSEDDPASYLTAAAAYVERQYSGKRAALRPVYDGLVKLGRSLGKDVRVCPCQTIVPLYRRHVFAQIRPGTNTRVDLGLALGKHKGRLPARLIDTGGKAKKDRITHRIELASKEDIDAELTKWLKIAYELDAD
ncbi:MAG: DUF5655 domain-containing protein [Phycisphaerales bacterium]